MGEVFNGSISYVSDY
jgi:alpha-amylase